MLSVVVVLGFFVVYGLLILSPPQVDPGKAAMTNQMLGFLGAGFSAVLGHWLGSSAGSARKTELMSQTPPPSMLGAVAAGVEATVDELNARELARSG